MHYSLPTLAILSDMLPGIIGAAGAVVISFVAITLVSSYYRFQHIVQKAEDTQPEEMGATTIDILRVQLARYLAGCARRNTSFAVAFIRLNDSEQEVRMGAPVVEAVKHAARVNDVTCAYDEQTIVLLAEMEPEDSIPVLGRIRETVTGRLPELSEDWCRVGIASYPGHGLSGKLLLEMAGKGLEQSTAEHPITMPEIVDVDAEEEEAPVVEPSSDAPEQEESATEGEEAESRGSRRKKSMLDELTGVLKPSAISAYMQRMMSELRHKKKKAALFCIGVNNMEYIERFHGEDTAGDVLAGVSRILQENLRSDDLIGRHEKYAFLVLAEASLTEAEVIGKRVSTLVQQSQIESGAKKIKVTITLGVAAYPEHGRNLHTLYKAGQKVLDYSRINDIRAYAVYDPEIHDSMPAKPMKSIKSVEA